MSAFIDAGEKSRDDGAQAVSIWTGREATLRLVRKQTRNAQLLSALTARFGQGDLKGKPKGFAASLDSVEQHFNCHGCVFFIGQVGSPVEAGTVAGHA